RKIFQNKMPGASENSRFGIGGMMMFDYAMSGVQKSTYASANLSYGIQLHEGNNTQRLTAGFGTIYGRRHIDFSRVDFEEQFTGYGFNTNLPTGEVALSNMKPYFSISAGLTYAISTERSNIDFGVAGFHLNRPKQTFLEDRNQLLSMRKVAHANFETFINDRVVFNANAIYQWQLQANYFSIGGALGYYLEDENATLLNAGMWYWSKNAVVPYIGLSYKDFQFGLSYDMTISKLYQATRRPKTWELSMIVRGISRPTGIIPCPWK
ncbi:MAG: PorP/SprF family type IX secretion system membrane protein, partial [Flavisolibacter sp.]|nr:PorP/SprF family type IX secretion system membrane protein [Flavisolibacter sp.]